jgi:c-di-GMP-binding flagellar brake protein YcgR
LFWKKKISETPTIELGHNSDNRRESFRLDTDTDNPIFGQFGEHRVWMRNISAGGLSFDWEGGRIGDRQPMVLTLPGRKGFSLSAQAEILTMSENRTCHCRFVDLDPTLEENIHQYVLHAQIFKLRKQRWERSRASRASTAPSDDQNTM